MSVGSGLISLVFGFASIDIAATAFFSIDTAATTATAATGPWFALLALGSLSILHIVDFCSPLHPVRCFWVETSSWAISNTLASVTLLPSLMILSEAKPLIMVSWRTLFCVSPFGYSSSFTRLSAFVLKSFRLMDSWNSLFNSTIAMRELDFGEISPQTIQISGNVVAIDLCDLLFSLPLVHQLHACFP